jgi:lipopolysaccharide export system permease protein
MTIYKYYIAKQLLLLFGMLTVVLAGVVWLMQSLRFVDLIVNRGLNVSTFLYFSALLLPSLLMVIIPIALFISVIYIYNKLISDSELVVFNGAGLSKFDLSRPALQVAVFVTLICYSISFYFLPVSYQKFKDLQTFIRNNYASVLLQEEVFSTPIKGVTMYVEARRAGGRLEGILVHDSRDPASPVTYIAKKAILQKTDNGPQFLLLDADAQKLNAQNNSLEVLHFDQYPLSLSTYIKAGDQRSKELEERFVGELFFPQEQLTDQQISKFQAEGHHRILWPLYTISLTLIALAGLLFGQFNRRGYWKKNVITTALGVVTLGLAIAAKSIVGNGMMVIVMYLPFIVATGCAIYFIFSYRMPIFPSLPFGILQKTKQTQSKSQGGEDV